MNTIYQSLVKFYDIAGKKIVSFGEMDIRFSSSGEETYKKREIIGWNRIDEN